MSEGILLLRRRTRPENHIFLAMGNGIVSYIRRKVLLGLCWRVNQRAAATSRKIEEEIRYRSQQILRLNSFLADTKASLRWSAVQARQDEGTGRSSIKKYVSGCSEKKTSWPTKAAIVRRSIRTDPAGGELTLLDGPKGVMWRCRSSDTKA